MLLLHMRAVLSLTPKLKRLLLLLLHMHAAPWLTQRSS
jgi:hypothetical protein